MAFITLLAIAAGDLSGDRLHSYHKLEREQQWIDQRQNAHAALNSKRRWKTIHKATRHYTKGEQHPYPWHLG